MSWHQQILYYINLDTYKTIRNKPYLYIYNKRVICISIIVLTFIRDFRCCDRIVTVFTSAYDYHMTLKVDSQS